MTSIKERRVR